MNHFFKACCMSMLIFSTPIHAKEQAPAIQKNGINVWETVIPNSKLLGFKAKTVIDAAPHEVLAVIMDVEHSGEWIPRTKSVETFENDKINGIAKVYIVVDMPFPLMDRELIHKDGNIELKNFLTDIAQKPPSKDFIRIPEYSGAWQLTKKADNKTAITITGHANPAGGLPSWVANMFVVDQPYQMLKNLKTQVKKPRYKKLAQQYIVKK